MRGAQQLLQSLHAAPHCALYVGSGRTCLASLTQAAHVYRHLASLLPTAPCCSYVRDLERGCFSVHSGVIQKRPGSGPNEPGSFQLVDHIQLATPETAPS